MEITKLETLAQRPVIAKLELPARAEITRPPPAAILDGPSKALITHQTGSDQLWLHQAMALEALLADQNPVIATGTASGKSLIFQTWAFHHLGLHPKATALVFDPLRALASDQTQSWQEQAAATGFNPAQIVKIDGSVPMAEREPQLRDCRIAIMTPDLCHAWLMRNLSHQTVQRFIANLALVVIDEAHVYESVFGSNAAYLFRRLLAAQARHAPPSHPPCRLIAATATVANAAAHLTKLTGQPFVEISEAHNGAQVHPRTLLHLEGEAEYDLAPIVAHAARLPDTKFIAFHDSRQGVERIARQISDGSVMAYRNGYESDDRRNVELALRHNRLKGVVATSALELGIHIPGLTLGLNLHVPYTRKSFRQRLGRIGRDAPGCFVIVAPANAFTQYGETLESYYAASAEPSLLYLQNEYIQFANAQCLARETGAPPTGGTAAAWPAGFERALKNVLSGQWPEKYRTIARRGRRHPHVAHALRQAGELELQLVNADDYSRRIGTINLDRAIREVYPQAGYLHRGRSYQAQAWRHDGSYGSCRIPLAEMPYHQGTTPDIVTEIEVKGTVDGHLALHQEPSKGYVAEVYATVTETVIGCQAHDGSNPVRYAPAEQPQRRFETTGVLLRIEEPWYCWQGPPQIIADTLQRYLCHNRSIAPWDISYSREPIKITSKQHPAGEIALSAAIVYDNTHGSLRLTEALFHQLPAYAAQLQKSIELAGEPIDPELIRALAQWADGLQYPTSDTQRMNQPQAPDQSHPTGPDDQPPVEEAADEQ